MTKLDSAGISRRTALAGLATAGVVLAAPGLVRAAPKRLKFGSFVGPTNPLNTVILQPWVERLSAASQDTMAIELIAGGAAPKPEQIMESVAAGIVDMAWGVPAYNPGRFATAGVAELPGLYDNALEGAVAMNALFDAGMLDGFDDVKIVGLGTSDIAYLHHRADISSMAGFDGAKIRASGNVGAKLCEAVGGTAVGMPVTSAAEALSRGIVDGVLADWFALSGFQLAPVTRTHLDLAGGGACIYVVMNQRTYDRLADEAKSALEANDAKAFGEFWGQALTDMNTKIRADVLAEPDHTLLEPTDAERATWAEASEKIIADWVDETADGGEAVQKVTTAVMASRKD